MDNSEQIQLMKNIIKQQEARIREQEDTIADLRTLVDELRLLKAGLEEALEEFRRKLFGTGSEKTFQTEDGGGTEHADSPAKEKIMVKSHARERKKKSTRNDMYEKLPVREVKIPVPEDERSCPYCNAQMETLGCKFAREEIRIVPAKIERIHYMQETLICPECKKDADGTLVQAEVPAPLLEHSPVSASIAAYTMYQRTFNSLPYCRQEKDLAQLGALVPRETMANWYISCAEKYFLPVYERMHELLLERSIIHADETPCQVLHEKGKTAESTSYMWVYLSGNDGLAPIILYEYQPGRHGLHPKNFLEGFSGMLHCDGYTGYNSVENATLVCCLAHCRRKFSEAVPHAWKKNMKLLDITSAEGIKEPVIPADDGKTPPAVIGVAYCNMLFFKERMLMDLDAEERKKRRIETEVPVWEDFWGWIGKLRPVGGSKLEKAVNYAINHHETLENHLLDGRCEISNNRAERRCKSYAIGRKNSLFHNGVAGAEASAVIYSIVETAKANGLNVCQYLYMVLLYMPECRDKPAGIEMLLPWSGFIKKYCTGLTDMETITPENHEKLPI